MMSPSRVVMEDSWSSLNDFRATSAGEIGGSRARYTARTPTGPTFLNEAIDAILRPRIERNQFD